MSTGTNKRNYQPSVEASLERITKLLEQALDERSEERIASTDEMKRERERDLRERAAMFAMAGLIARGVSTEPALEAVRLADELVEQLSFGQDDEW